MTAAQFRSRAVRMFRTANRDADAVGVAIVWEFTGRVHTNPRNGHRMRSGHFRATAPGYRTRSVLAWHDVTTGEFSVR